MKPRLVVVVVEKDGNDIMIPTARLHRIRYRSANYKLGECTSIFIH